MFLDFFNLREQPFGVTPDPKYLYLSPTHREALASLLYGIRCGRGFMTLIAQPGMGKTTLLFCLLERLRNSSKTAFLFQTQCNSQELLRHLLADLGIENSSQDVVEMHQQLNKLLLREAENGRRVVVIIDEAQNLSDEVLESVRLLSNFETTSTKLIQVILAGQPPLADKLARPSLAQLRQRLSIMARLEPFSPTETDHYIHHRLWASGYSGKNEPFNPEARALIAAFSEGIPRNINNLCFNALSLGFAMQKRTIDGVMVREVAADSDIASLGSERPLSANSHPSDPLAQSEPTPQTRQGALLHALAMAGEESQLEWSPPTGPGQADRPATPVIPSSLSRPRPVSFSPVEKGRSPRRALQVAMVGALLVVLYCSFVIHPSAKGDWPNSPTAMAAAVPSPTAMVAAALPPTVWSAAVPSSLVPVVARPNEISSISARHYLGRSGERVAEKNQQRNRKLTKPDPIERGQLILPAFAKIKDEPVVSPTGTVGVVGGVPSGVPGGTFGGVLDGVPGGMVSSVVVPSLPPMPSAPERIRVGDQVEAAKLIFQPKTEYPPQAEREHIQGSVRLEAVISKDGTMRDLKVLSGHPLLVKSALQAVQRWRFQPALLNGEPVEAITKLAVDFTLRGVQ